MYQCQSLLMRQERLLQAAVPGRLLQFLFLFAENYHSVPDNIIEVIHEKNSTHAACKI